MKALTLRGIDPAMDHALKQRAKQSGLSVNSTILQLLREACGLDKQKHHVEYNDLDELAGTWTIKEQQAFDEYTSAFSEVDEELWK